MAKFLPTGWRMSQAGVLAYQANEDLIETLIRQRVRKYNLQSIGRDDLAQEARLAAAYAVDTFDVNRATGATLRSKFCSYVGSVISRVLAMIACEALAQCRTPYATVRDGDGWRRIPAEVVDATDDVLDRYIVEVEDTGLVARERKMERSIEVHDIRCSLAGLPDDARMLAELRISPPAELSVLARNMGQGRSGIGVAALSQHLGWSKDRVKRASRIVDQHFAEARA